MANRKRTIEKGGKRQGSGRKPTIHTVCRMTICLDRMTWEALRRYAERRAVTLAQAVRELILGGAQ